jgi:hypothetical protein
MGRKRKMNGKQQNWVVLTYVLNTALIAGGNVNVV